ncbi:MAG: cytochrome c1 [Gammaproteobacteria bacterium]|nr:cytochrome c1 [Gammaproteobacteria bacterium]
MKKTILAILMVLPTLAMAAGGAYTEKVDYDLHNKESLQNGAKLFVNYCLSCHSAAYQRYNRMGDDLGLTDAQVKANLMFAADKVGETMTVALQTEDAKKMFGTKVPDLSVVSRARGADWLYTYLRTFYKDDSRPFGVNNVTFADVGMPHVLWELEGMKKLVNADEMKAHPGTAPKFEKISEGKMSAAEYDSAMRDLTAFMVYMGEPAKLVRYELGIWVILFLVILFLVAYPMKKEFWKDIH